MIIDALLVLGIIGAVYVIIRGFRQMAENKRNNEALARNQAQGPADRAAGKDWTADPMTNRQAKLLKLFRSFDPHLTKRQASEVIDGLFTDPDKVALWEAYKALTGDDGAGSPDLMPVKPMALVREQARIRKEMKAS
jgi:hypothetical protein